MKKKETVFYISYLKHTIHFEKFQFNSKQRCYQQNDREKKNKERVKPILLFEVFHQKLTE